MRKIIVIFGLVLLLVGASFVSSGLGITKKIEEQVDVEPTDDPYMYYIVFAEIYTSEDFEAIGMIKTEVINTLAIWIQDGLEFEGATKTGIQQGKLILNTKQYGEIELGPGCSVSFDFTMIGGDISYSGTDKILYSRITKIDGYAGEILITSPEPIPDSHSKQMFTHPIFVLLQRILQRPIFSRLLNL